jgi:ribonuclease PH
MSESTVYLFGSVFNSSLFSLFINIYGRVNQAQGVLTFYGPECRNILIPNPAAFTDEQRERLLNAFEQMAQREVKSIFEEDAPLARARCSCHAPKQFYTLSGILYPAMRRVDGRAANELRPIVFEPGFHPYAEGSCLISMGNTRVIITATVEDKTPPFLKGTGSGWVTAEYSMLPRAGKQRSQREVTRGTASGRTMEIQRLIGRAIRAVVELSLLGERTITLDCDVIQADGGTRTACITGGFVAFVQACRWMMDQGYINRLPFQERVAAISVGVVRNDDLLDLCYEEDVQAAVDMNIVMTDRGRFVEVQGTAESAPFSRDRLNRLLDLAQGGLQQIFQLQAQAIEAVLSK